MNLICVDADFYPDMYNTVDFILTMKGLTLTFAIIVFLVEIPINTDLTARIIGPTPPFLYRKVNVSPQHNTDVAGILKKSNAYTRIRGVVDVDEFRNARYYYDQITSAGLQVGKVR